MNLLKYVEYVRLSSYDGGNVPMPVFATGSFKSRLMRILKDGHYDVSLTVDEWRALAAWIDCNAPYLGSWADIDISNPSPEAMAVLPYSQDHIDARKKELENQSPEGFQLCCYIDCGVQTGDINENGPSLKQLSGRPYRYNDVDNAAADHFDLIAFDDLHIIFEAGGLDPGKKYMLGFSWWDYNSNGRVQNVYITDAKATTSKTILPVTKLPGYQGAGELPAIKSLHLPGEFYKDGNLRITIGKIAGANVVLSEIWLWQSTKTLTQREYLTLK